MPDCIFHPAAAVIHAHLKKKKRKKRFKREWEKESLKKLHIYFFGEFNTFWYHYLS